MLKFIIYSNFVLAFTLLFSCTGDNSSGRVGIDKVYGRYLEATKEGRKYHPKIATTTTISCIVFTCLNITFSLAFGTSTEIQDHCGSGSRRRPGKGVDCLEEHIEAEAATS